jgi:hypothetical protein
VGRGPREPLRSVLRKAGAPDAFDPYAQYTGHDSRYVDDVRSWQTAEPADDFAAIAVYALT